MARKGKGKQKQEEKPPTNDLAPVVTETSKPAVTMPTTETNFHSNSPAEPQLTSWGATGDNTWGATGDTWGTPAQPGPDAWNGGGGQHAEDTWDHPESLLQPPPGHSHNILSSERPSSGQFIQNRTPLSVIGETQDEYRESLDEYSDDYNQPNAHAHAHPREWEGSRSSTLATTAAPSAMGSPPPAPPMISLAEATATAQKQMQNHPTSSASQAAKKLEENRARPAEFATGVQSSAVSAVGPHDAAREKVPTRQPLSTASAAAAAFEANMMGKRKKAQSSPNATPSGSQQPKKTGLNPLKPFLPNAREPAAIEVDYSWTRTGGNAWSNKYRLDPPKTGQPQQHVHQQQQAQQPQARQHQAHQYQAHQQQPHQQQPRQQQPHQHHQAQQLRQTQQQQQQPQYQRHQSIPVHATHQAHSQQNPGPAAWRAWGREGVDQMEGTYDDSDEETIQGWNFRQGGDGWGQSPGGWAAQQPAGKHDKTHRQFEDRREQGNGWGQQQQQPVKDPWAQTNDGWSQDHRGQGHRGQGHRGQDHRSQDQWGQDHRGQDHRGQDHRSQDHRGQDQWGQGGDEWGKEGGDGWGQDEGGATDGWGKGAADGWGKGAADGWSKGVADGWGKGAADRWGKGAADGWGKGGAGQGVADGWGQEEGNGWGQQAQGGETGWGNTPEHGWGSQAAGAGRASLNNEWGGTAQAKVKFTAAEAAGSRNVVSPQQRSQILNSLLNNQPQTQNNHTTQLASAAHAAQIAAAAKYQAQMAQMKAHQGHHQGHHQEHHQEHREAWEAEESSDGWGSDEDDEHNRRVHFSPKWSEVWGGSPRSIPTKALAHAHAQQGIKTTLINDASNVRFAESRGAAFAYVADAFFGNARLARERIHWLFPPNKDKRVAEMLAWVQKMSFNLGTYGLVKFLETRERGALFINVAFRMRQHPQEPAIDWLTFSNLQGTMDKILQESAAFYDPAALVTVFVYLPSQTGNSVAIWRRKINVPEKARNQYRTELNAIVKTLPPHKDYIVMVDELPKPKLQTAQKPGQLRKSLSAKAAAKPSTTATRDAKKKRKWWKFFLS